MNASVRVVVWLIAAVLTQSGCAKGAPSRSNSDRNCSISGGVIGTGAPLPQQCQVEVLDRQTFVTLGDARAGKPMVINFWASWCVFCIKEMPDFQKVFAKSDGRVAFLGLDLLGLQGETRVAAATLAAKTGVRYPLAYDEDGVLYGHFAPRLLMPTTIFVRADGTVAYTQYGPLTAVQLREGISKYLNVEVPT